WPRPARAAARLGLTVQERARDRLARAAEVVTADPAEGERQRILAAAWQLARSFPPRPLPLLPTALGNTLRAAEATAGAEYGADAVVKRKKDSTPCSENKSGPSSTTGATSSNRRVPPEKKKKGATGMPRVPLVLGADGWWRASPAVFLLPAWVAYRAAVAAARGYGEALSAAFDLHRFDLLTALHLTLPADPEAERVLGRRLTRFWAQGVPLTALPYEHQHEREPAPHTAAPPAAPGDDGSR
ncbi:LOW QUALITY PROTEIN: predicted protein, partial [Streptomyces sp. C]